MFKGFVDMTVEERLFPVIQVVDRAELFIVGPGMTLLTPVPIPVPACLELSYLNS